MKHAILLLFHKNPQQLIRMMSCFDDDFVFYIHIDRKTELSSSELESIRKAHPHVHLYSRYKVYWGSIAILKAELYLLEEILKHEQCDYIHFMSGQDYPIKHTEEIKNYFRDYRGYEFIEYMPLPDKRWEQGTYLRFDLYRLNDFIDYHTPHGCRCIELFNRWQLQWGIRRPVPRQFPRLYGGSNWMSLTTACARYVMEHRHKHRAFFRRLRFTFAPDEVYFHTVILNSPFASRVVNDNRRLICWDGHSGSPITLTHHHWWEVATSNRLFARKLDEQISHRLQEYIHRYLLQREKISIGNTGRWESHTFSGHAYDNGLGQALLHLLSYVKPTSIADFGCGPGWYVALLRRHGYDVQGYDGNPTVEFTSSLFFNDGFHCLEADLTDELESDEPFDLVISLEVGEHIAPCWEETYLHNLTRNAGRYILLSWAVENQLGDGHVNCHSNEYICNQMHRLGFLHIPSISRYLRHSASLWWFKQTIMFFQKQ